MATTLPNENRPIFAGVASRSKTLMFRATDGTVLPITTSEVTLTCRRGPTADADLATNPTFTVDTSNSAMHHITYRWDATHDWRPGIYYMQWRVVHAGETYVVLARQPVLHSLEEN